MLCRKMYNDVATFMSDNLRTDTSSLILLYSNRKATHPSSIIMHRYTKVRICMSIDSAAWLGFTLVLSLNENLQQNYIRL